MPKIHNMHDKYFRSIMENLQVAKEFFLLYLPPEILKLIDLNTLELQNTSLINLHLDQLWCDILFKVKLSEKSGHIYLLVEHQSLPQRMMPFRILQYSTGVMVEDVHKRRTYFLPVVIPIVFYHGKSPYYFSTDIGDLFGEHKAWAPIALKPFKLIDVNQIDDEEIKKHEWLGVLEYVQKYIGTKDLFYRLINIIPLFNQLEIKGAQWYIISTLKYAFSAGALADSQVVQTLLLDKLSFNTRREMMTYAEYLKQEARQEGLQKGVQKGIQQGKQLGKSEAVQQIAIKLLQEKVDLALIARTTGLTFEQIKQLAACGV